MMRSTQRLAWLGLAVTLLTSWMCGPAKAVDLVEGDDLYQVIQDNPGENEFILKGGLSDVVYEISAPIVVDRDLTIEGKNDLDPFYLPTTIEVQGVSEETCLEPNYVEDESFEEAGSGGSSPWVDTTVDAPPIITNPGEEHVRTGTYSAAFDPDPSAVGSTEIRSISQVDVEIPVYNSQPIENSFVTQEVTFPLYDPFANEFELRHLTQEITIPEPDPRISVLTRGDITIPEPPALPVSAEMSQSVSIPTSEVASSELLTLEQDVVIEPGAKLSMQLKIIGSRNPSATLEVLVDGASQRIIQADEAPVQGSYWQTTVSFKDGVDDGGMHTLSFVANIIGGTGSCAFFLDDLCLSTDVAACSDNKLSNFDFESGSAGWIGNTEVIISDADQAADGSGVAQFGTFSDLILQFYVKLTEDTGPAPLELFFDGDLLVTYDITGFPEGVYQEVSLTVPPRIAWVSVQQPATLKFVSTTESVFYIDDVSLTNNGADNQVQNSDFESNTQWSYSATYEMRQADGNANSDSYAARFGKPAEVHFRFALEVDPSGNSDDYLEISLADEFLGKIEGSSSFSGIMEYVVPETLWNSTVQLRFESYITRVPTATTFWIDDICVTVDPEDINCTDNTVVEPGFEDLRDLWVEDNIPDGEPIIVTENPISGAWSAKLGGIDPDEWMLDFELQIKDPSGNGEDILFVNFDNTPLLVLNESAPAYAGGYTRVNSISLLAYTPGDYTLEFFSRVKNAEVPTVFLVDDVCIHRSTDTGCTDNLVDDAGFEEQSGDWTESSTTSSLSIVVESDEAKSGDFVAWLGGLTPEPIIFSFYLKVLRGAGGSRLRVYLDDPNNASLLVISDTDPAYLDQWQKVEIDVSDYAGDTHTLFFSGETEKGQGESFFLIDDVCIQPNDENDSDCTNNIVEHPSFEGEESDPKWTQISASGVDLIVEDKELARNGDWVVRFGGLLQEVLLNFQLSIDQGSGTASDVLRVLIDGVEVDSITADDATYTGGYATHSIDLSSNTAIADGGLHSITFESENELKAAAPRFFVDGVCLSVIDGEGSCPENRVQNGGFEEDPADSFWTQLDPSGDPIIIEDAAYAYEGSHVARLGGVPLEIGEIYQEDVEIPEGVTQVCFFIKTEQTSGSDFDVLKVIVDDEAPAVIQVGDGSIGDEFTFVCAEIPASVADDGLHRLRFVGELEKVDQPTHFYVDDICLSPMAGEASPIFSVLDGNSLTLTGLSFTNASRAVVASDAGSIEITRCYFHDMEEEALFISQATEVQMIGSVIVASGGDGILVDSLGTGANVNVFHSTLIQNGGYGCYAKNGIINVGACLVDGNGGSLRSDGATFNSYYNRCDVEEEGDITLPLPAARETEFSYDTGRGWEGAIELTNPIYAGTNSYSSITDAGLPFEGKPDFENQARGEDLQVGADEVGGIYAATWDSCVITPNPVGPEIAPATISISLTGVTDLADIDVYLLPEQGNLYSPVALIPIGSLQGDGTTGTITYSPPATFVGVDGIEGTVLLDGRATVLLGIGDSSLMGLGYDTTRMSESALSGSQFVIDTVAPQLTDGSLLAQAGRYLDSEGAWLNGLVSSNDTETTTVDSPPADWGPAILDPEPSSYDGLDYGSGAPQIFLNTGSTAYRDASPLSFTVTLDAYDPSPVDTQGNGYEVELAGFDAYDSPDSTASVAEILRGPEQITVTDGLGGALYTRPFGALRATVEEGAGYLNNAGGVSVSMLPTGDYDQELQGSWSLSDILPFAEGWRASLRFELRDRAANLTQIVRPLHVWWMRYPQATLTSAPSNGTEVSDPEFAWELNRYGGAAPVNALPSYPIASFKIWEDLSGVGNGPWADLTDWSPWTHDRVIAKPSLVQAYQNAATPAIYLLDVLSANPGKYLMITVMGADEAGNEQILPFAEGASLLNDTSELMGDGDTLRDVAYSIWKNPDDAGMNLDTEVIARFWHNRASINTTWRTIEADETDFGSSTRIPLPPSRNCEYRVEGEFKIRVEIPSQVKSEIGQDDNPGTYISVNWELFEDGRRVDGGVLTPNSWSLVPVMSFYLPSDLLLNPPGDLNVNHSFSYQDYLNLCKTPDYYCLGDEPNRLRDVNYLATFRTSVTDPVTGEIYEDSTPASVMFTIYVDETFEDSQPIKSFSRE